MDKKLFLSKISLVAAVAVFILGVFGYLSLNDSLAWFSSNKDVDANGMSLSILVPEEYTADIYVHEVLGKDGDTGTLYFKEASTNVTNGYIPMPQYNILHEADRHLLVHVIMRNTTERVSLTAATSTDYVIDGNEKKLLPAWLENGVYTDENASYDNCISSIISFAQVTATITRDQDYTYVNKNNETTTERALHFVMPQESEFNSFANFVENDLTLNKPSFEAASTDDNGEFYLLISYNETNVEWIYSENIGNDAFSHAKVLEAGGIVYKMDFTLTLGFAPAA